MGNMSEEETRVEGGVCAFVKSGDKWFLRGVAGKGEEGIQAIPSQKEKRLRALKRVRP
jgi:hypothetical protein